MFLTEDALITRSEELSVPMIFVRDGAVIHRNGSARKRRDTAHLCPYSLLVKAQRMSAESVGDGCCRLISFPRRARSERALLYRNGENRVFIFPNMLRGGVPMLYDTFNEELELLCGSMLGEIFARKLCSDAESFRWIADRFPGLKKEISLASFSRIAEHVLRILFLEDCVRTERMPHDVYCASKDAFFALGLAVQELLCDGVMRDCGERLLIECVEKRMKFYLDGIEIFDTGVLSLDLSAVKPFFFDPCEAAVAFLLALSAEVSITGDADKNSYQYHKTFTYV